MKEATGELSITVITVVAVAAVAALFYTLVWPTIQKTIVNNTCSMYGEGYHAVKRDDAAADAAKLSGANAANQKYGCCEPSVTSWNDNKCIK